MTATEPDLVEWGTERARPDWLLGSRWHPRLGWVLAGLGALALLASLVGEWQVTRITLPTDAGEGFLPPAQEFRSGVSELVVWGTSWLVGAMALAISVTLVVSGGSVARPLIRTAGLAVAGVLLVLLVAITVDLQAGGPFESGSFFGSGEEQHEHSLGWGLFAAYGTVVVMAAALWVTRAGPANAPDRAAGPDGRILRQAEPSEGYAGPPDLTVAPAAPLALLADPDERR